MSAICKVDIDNILASFLIPGRKNQLDTFFIPLRRFVIPMTSAAHPYDLTCLTYMR
jgi:hypothetical protein